MKSIKRKMLTLLLPILLVAVTSIALITFWKSNKVITSKINSIMNERLESNINAIEGDLSRGKKSVEVLRQFLSDTPIKTEEEYNELLGNLVLANENVVGMGIFFAPYQFDSDSKGKAFYAGKNNEKITYDSSYSNTDYFSEDYYELPENIGEGEVVWTEPYFDSIANVSMVTAAAPLYYNEELLAVLTVDISLENIESIVSNIEAGTDERVILASQEGVFLYSDNSSSIMDEYINRENAEGSSFQVVGNEVLNNSSGTYAYTDLNNDTIKVYHSTVPNTNWNLLFLISQDEIMKDSVNLLIYIIIIGVIVLVIITVTIILFANYISKRLEMIREHSELLGLGDFRHKLAVGTDDEIGIIAQALNKTIENLSVLILGSKDTLGNVRNSFTNVKGEVREINESIIEMDTFLNVLATDMDTQVAGLKESSVAIDGIANGIQQIAESSTSVAELTAETSTQANDGIVVIEKSVTQMETINRVVDNTSNVVDRLVRRTKTIDKALKAITAIAEQTNLLALNASIEAARAGEHGRGFAVVADEVSKLAAQSKESANEINVLLQEINEDTKEAVNAMEQGKMESKQGIEVIRQAGEAFSSIVEQITMMTEQVQEVSATVEEMSAGTEEVNSSLSDVVRSSEAISIQTLEAVQKNNAQVEVVNKIVNVMNEANEGVEKLEEDLNEFKTESEKEME